ncbi:DUF4870 domain-containing protein [Pseudomonas sp. ZM23]|uniref:DUF4870 domain-containing protein n=1 Tax=Pseudomonas triclosanedens TaxID=2961893 RepID=A0ABY6ZWZ0_9PSED|nr:DUF4870 domain-containing protein [Pseudomonas triclosanedens]MCP8466946.1 DUF4870 domain-containing protein [Pseudomonas triclosanedens]MCP8470170.1 DUF4870 domain-containing protein [Pseudomonas triclosanedens]MCP8478080.1 DUF4870 domain-containing protein [Pseudomonas triclosanedens]WAI49489.1 DUF4870 domain-containing protein [Pseudomonas triclosanedens]
MSDEVPVQRGQPSQEARQWAMFCHLAAFLGFFLPIGNLIGPLIIWQLKRETDAFVDQQGKEALNFQITVTIALTISCLLMLLLVGFVLAGLVVVAALILTIIAGVKASEGVDYRYPFTWRPLR